MKKYTLTKTTKEWFGITLFQIKAEKDFKDVGKGELGGFIEKEENLDQDGNAWVYGDAWVYGNAWVYGDAQVSGNAQVSGKLKLLAGFFFGFRYKKEEIKYVKIDNDMELIYKGEAKFGEEEKEVSLSGKTVKVSLDDKEYEAVIK